MNQGEGGGWDEEKSEGGTSGNNVSSGLVLVLLKVLLEHTSEFLKLSIVSSLIIPSVLGHEDARVDASARFRHIEVEGWEFLEFSVFELSTVDRVNDLTGHLQAHALADSVLTT